MKNLTFFFALFLSCFFSISTNSYAQGAFGVAPPQEIILPNGEQVQGSEDIDRLVYNFMQKWNLKGGSLSVVKNGKLVYAKGFGFSDDARQQAVMPNTSFRLASVTKPVTCIAILQLVQKNLIKLDDKVFGATGILPEYNNLITDNRLRSITVRQLLMHQAGWNRKFDSNGNAYSPEFEPTINKKTQIEASEGAYTRKAVMDYMVKRNLDFKPGDSTEYSNFGYFVLGRIIVKKSGLLYEDYIQKNICQPLGIGSMQIGGDTEAAKALTETTYFNSGSYSYTMDIMDSHGGLIASAPAMSAIMSAVDKNSTGTKLLSNALIDTMFSSPKGRLCWSYSPTYDGYYHNGKLTGTATQIMLRKNGFAVAALFNGSDNDTDIYTDMRAMMGDATNVSLPTTNLLSNEVVLWRVPVTAYQAKFDEMKAQGYRPAVIEGYQIGTTAYFDLIFRKDGIASIAFHGLTAAQYQTKFNEVSTPYTGFDLSNITNYAYNGQLYYAGVFTKTNNPNYRAHHNQTEASFNSQHATNLQAGYKLVQGAKTKIGSTTYICSIYSK